jgi:hypothetical protein
VLGRPPADVDCTYNEVERAYIRAVGWIRALTPYTPIDSMSRRTVVPRLHAEEDAGILQWRVRQHRSAAVIPAKANTVNGPSTRSISASELETCSPSGELSLANVNRGIYQTMALETNLRAQPESLCMWRAEPIGENRPMFSMEQELAS